MDEYNELFSKNYVRKDDVARKLNKWIVEFGVLVIVTSLLSLFGLVTSVFSKNTFLSAIFFLVLCCNVYFLIQYLFKRWKYLQSKYFSKGAVNNKGEELI